MDTKSFFEYVDKTQDEFVGELKKWVAIPSVSSDPQRRDDCFSMVEFVAGELHDIGCEYVEIIQNPAGMQKLQDGSKIPYCPFLLASYGSDPSKKTVCIYGHLDVQPAKKTDGWSTEPFELEEVDGKLYGRGSTDDKGPVLAWLCVIRSFKKIGIKMDINIKFLFEAMEECGSSGLDDFIFQQKDKFLKDVDYICISDNYWLGTSKPCITYGLRGVMYFGIEVSGPRQDLHSGLFGGTVHEPLVDLFSIMGKLVKTDGTILIPGIMDQVAKVTDEEIESYKDIDFSPEEFRENTGCSKLIYSSKKDILMHRWRYPSLSLHGVEGAFYSEGEKTVIPAKVIGKFSIRTVPHMEVEKTKKLVVDYITDLQKKLDSPNLISVSMYGGSVGWVTDFNHKNFVAGRRAIKKVFGVEPDLTREGGSIPVALTFEEALKKSVMLLPVGRADDGAHSQNEKLDRINFVSGIKVLGCYIDEISRM